MKKIFTLSLAAMMGFGVANADVPRFFDPGHAKRVERVRPAKKMRAVAAPKQVAAPAKAATYQAPAATEFVDRLLKYDAMLGSHGFTVSYTYDEYGFPKELLSTSSNTRSVYTYEWKVPGKVWSSKKVETFDENGNLMFTDSHIRRTFHDNGAVRSSEVNNGGESTTYTEYDENGYMTLQKESDEYIRHYVYFALLDQWYEGYEGSWHKELVALDGDNGLRTEVWDKDGDEWKLYSQRVVWYAPDGSETGGMELNYDYNADRVNGYGSRTEVQTSESGIVELTYELAEGDNGLVMENGKPVWVLMERTTYSANFYDPIVYTPGEVRTMVRERNYDGQWRQTASETFSWVKDGIVKEVYDDDVYNEHYTEYYFVVDGKLSDDDFYYDEATGCYVIEDYLDSYDYYTFYDANGKITNKLRENTEKEGAPEWEQWSDKSQSWEKCSGTIVINDSDGDRDEITFDAQGRVVMEVEYEEGRLDSRSEYTYTENGYIEKYYGRYNYSTGELMLSSEETYTLVDGIGTTIELEYGTEGEVLYGYKYVEDNNRGIRYSYNWTESGEWELGYTYVRPLTEQLADGSVVTIERELDENGDIVNTQKRIEKATDTYELVDHYIWDRDLNIWIGGYRSERKKVVMPDFKMIEPVKPWDFQDEYFFPATPGHEYEPVVDEWFYCYWNWDYDKNEWVCQEGAPEYSMPDEYTLVVKQEGYGRGSVRTVKVDSQRRVIEQSEHVYDEYNNDEVRQTWTYDDKGRVLNDTEYRSDGEVWTYDFTYGPVEVVEGAGVDDVVAGTPASVTVYNLQGICVLRDAAPEAVKALPEGLYIVNGKKLIVR